MQDAIIWLLLSMRNCNRTATGGELSVFHMSNDQTSYLPEAACPVIFHNGGHVLLLTCKVFLIYQEAGFQFFGFAETFQVENKPGRTLL